MNEVLTKQFMREEVEAALKQMAPLKASILDGFNPDFYQTNWHIVGDDVTSVVLKFLNECIFDKCINFTYIALISKIKCSVSASDFHLICLCNIIYKLESKFLANKLK